MAKLTIKSPKTGKKAVLTLKPAAKALKGYNVRKVG